MYARLDCGHLAARALQRDADGLLCAAEKCLVELVQRDELRIQLRQILDIQIDSEKLIDKFKDRPTPAVILIPGREGSMGLGQSALKAAVERAVGTNILGD